MDKQHQVAAPRRVLRASGLRRYVSLQLESDPR